MHLSRGMSVQSPWAYRFIRYVVNEHYPYYAYEDLRRKYPDVDKRREKLCRFYFRLSNFCQPSYFFNYAPHTVAYEVYVQNGCANCQVNTQHSDGQDILQQMKRIDLARVSLVGDYTTVIEDVMKKMHTGSVLVIEHIKRDTETKSYWNALMQDSRVGVSFDLYYCGVLFFDKKLYKQTYKVNF